MSSKVIIDILVNIESFRNIDLYYQGLYYMQLQIYQLNQNERTFACPYDIQHNAEQALTFHSIIKPQIIEQTSSYCTKVFMIKYSDEVVKIQEAGIFRIESSLYSNSELIVEVELYFTDLGGELTAESISKFTSDPTSAPAFNKVGSCCFKCVEWKYGLNQFCPIVFSDTYASSAALTLHTMLLDYKFRNEGHEVTEYPLISHCLFPLCGHNVLDDNINKIFKDYILPLVACHNKTRRLIKKIHKTSTAGKGIKLKRAIKPPVTFESAQPICKAFNTRNKKKVTKVFIKEIKEIASLVWQMRYDLESTLKKYSSESCRYLEEKYHEKVRNLSMEHIYREVQIGEVSIVAEGNPMQSRTARAHRRSVHSCKKEILEAYNVRIFAPERLAIMFEEIYIKSGELIDEWNAKWFCVSRMSAEKHLIVLAHGYMGSSYDLKALRDVLLLYKPNLLVIVSEANEKDTQGCISEMGLKLSKEITTYIASLPDHIVLTRLSFIGHSLGGLIIRAALPHLQDYKKIMYAFISLSSPHLGCAKFSNKLVEAGLWVISKLRNSTCIQQLTLKDYLNPRQCFLYNLAKNSKLSCFTKVVLVSSSQDSYVPFESARIEIGIESPDTIQLEMADFIAGSIKQLHRINVDFPIKEGIISNLHGRAAHISVLDNQSFLNILVYRFAEFFNTR